MLNFGGVNQRIITINCHVLIDGSRIERQTVFPSLPEYQKIYQDGNSQIYPNALYVISFYCKVFPKSIWNWIGLLLIWVDVHNHGRNTSYSPILKHYKTSAVGGAQIFLWTSRISQTLRCSWGWIIGLNMSRRIQRISGAHGSPGSAVLAWPHFSVLYLFFSWWGSKLNLLESCSSVVNSM